LCRRGVVVNDLIGAETAHVSVVGRARSADHAGASYHSTNVSFVVLMNATRWAACEATPNQAQVRARCLAHLAFSSPPLFTALGVVLYLLHSSSDYVVWALIWIPISLAAIAGASERRAAASRPETTAGSPWRRIAHGFSALAILLMFIVPHIANHLTAIWSAICTKR
jgi:hypothetical protein